MKLIECVPNFSEGRDTATVQAITDRIAAVPGVSILHVTSDTSHNRSVITFVAPADVMPDAAFAAIRAARDHIDLSLHSGVHPRIGAADVVPFIPLDGADMQDCVAIARAVGERVGRELEIPVYLYEHAATRRSRRNLADVRRGGYETLRNAIASDPDRAPDFGPARIHPTFGAVAIGARPFLIAFNVYIGGVELMPVARAVARAVRESSGGLSCVKALALEVDGQAQVSMNLVDVEQTPLSVVFDTVERELRARDAHVTWSEIIGLVPERVVLDVAATRLALRQPLAEQVLERRLLDQRASTQSLHEYVESVGSGDPFPGGGSVAALVAALAASLTRMVAGLTLGRPRYAAAESEMLAVAAQAQQHSVALLSLARRDSEAYAGVTDARALPTGSADLPAARTAAIQTALIAAARVPLDVAEQCEVIARLTLIVAKRGNQNALTDAGVAAALLSAAATAASYNVRVNVAALDDPASDATEMVRRAVHAVASADRIAREVAALVDAAL